MQYTQPIASGRSASVPRSGHPQQSVAAAPRRRRRHAPGELERERRRRGAEDQHRQHVRERARQSEPGDREQRGRPRPHRRADDEDQSPRGDRRREHVVDEAPPERERKEDRREERRVRRRPPQHAHERDHRSGHGDQRQGDDEPPGELDRHDAREARDDEVKEPVVGEIVELVLGVLRGRWIPRGAAPRR